jgi:hypothetical protein
MRVDPDLGRPEIKYKLSLFIFTPIKNYV